MPAPTLERIPSRPGEKPEAPRLGAPGVTKHLNEILLAARSGRCAAVRYRGVERVVEPYALRRQRLGNVLLYVYEQTKGGTSTGGWRTYDAAEIEGAKTTNVPFTPQYEIEL